MKLASIALLLALFTPESTPPAGFDMAPVYVVHTYCDRHQHIDQPFTAGGLVGVVITPAPAIVIECNGGPHDYQCDTVTHGEWIGVLLTPLD